MNATRRCHNSIVAFCEDGEVLPSDCAVQCEVFPLGRFRWTFDRHLRGRLERRLQSAASIHIHGIWQEHCSIAASVARKLGIPYVISAHGMLEPWALNQKRWRKALYATLVERHTLARATCVRALTGAEAEHYRQFGFKGRIDIIPNGIHIPPEGDCTAFLRQFPALRGRRIVLFLGRLHKKKGIDVLCHAWKSFGTSLHDCVLVFAGPDSPEAPGYTQRLVQELGLTGSVVFTGMLGEEMKWSALRAATVFVLASHSEGFSVAVLEALASAKPVIIGEACYFPEVAQSGCGWVTTPEPSRLARELGQCLRMNEAELSEFGRRGLEMIKTRYTWDKIGERMAALHCG